MRLQGKTALITGGAAGIGRETAALFAQEGARVIIADYNKQQGEEAIQALLQKGADAHFIEVDVSDSGSVTKMAAEALARNGAVDVLINNAGITQDRTLAKMTEEEWHRVIQVNLNGVFYCTKALIHSMIERGSGKIISTASIVGVHGNIGQTNYAATKAGIIGMTKTWAKELGPKGIQANAVAPGFIETGMVANMPEKVVQQMLEKIPLRRLGRPMDVANAYLFLASSESDYVNGTVLEVNGGLVI
ncbi:MULTISPECIES: 3-oxoacyl-ACP reductase FabG [Paenibacillus]|uniref:3-oxoacyl-ACP reductase FabG n=1 Tax=Paenibacillus TaxID=44249 RepID=UPI001C1FF63D|nr:MULTISPECIES: 3-oxoacyl-ACP reductase FabG [Paenibacillus]MBU7315074.1 3-oxoacyl-ACP reductase FabG [Paenibacillus oleatilyticus]MCP1308005.1 3-oxoacyl-ACP reductase FabG [Paenibacillus tyrfis]